MKKRSASGRRAADVPLVPQVVTLAQELEEASELLLQQEAPDAAVWALALRSGPSPPGDDVDPALIDPAD
jgi:hypothetical protein